jgi:hypothetical protein
VLFKTGLTVYMTVHFHGLVHVCTSIKKIDGLNEFLLSIDHRPTTRLPTSNVMVARHVSPMAGVFTGPFGIAVRDFSPPLNLVVRILLKMRIHIIKMNTVNFITHANLKFINLASTIC